MTNIQRLSLVLIVIAICSSLILAQKPQPKDPKFDYADFNRKFETARWLVEYDTVAWKTTDFLMERHKTDLPKLGAEWFCFQDKNKAWHAVYGKLENDKYNVVVHLLMESNSKIVSSADKIDQSFLDSHAKALSTAQEKLTTLIPPDAPRFNQYIRRNLDGTFTVWLLPAFQTNGVAVYGGEAVFEIEASGKKITKDESYFQKAFRGFKSEPPREIWLNFSEQEKPSLGAVFFVWYYKQYFTKIFIENAKSTSTLVKNGNDYLWLHVEKEESGPTK